MPSASWQPHDQRLKVISPNSAGELCARLSQPAKSLLVIVTFMPTSISICWIACTMRWSKVGAVNSVKLGSGVTPASFSRALAFAGS